MKDNKFEIKQGINVHEIETNKFKTNLCAIFLSTPLDRKNITQNAIIPMVLRRGSIKIQNQEEISKALEEMYGAEFDCGIEKSGNNQILKFYLESLNDNFIEEKENILEKSLDLLIDIVFNPLIKENKFNDEYVLGEKENLKQIIQSKIDNKARFAYERCIEEMYKGNPYGLYRFGYEEDLENINSSNLYEYYKKLINECKIDIFVSGDIKEKAKQILQKNEAIKSLKPRGARFIVNGNEQKEKTDEKVVIQNMKVNQGKLVIGLDILEITEEEKYIASVYNILLGGSSNSKLFQNVREKASLAYTCGSSYLRQKNNIIIRAGIEIEKYNEALELIKKQIKDMESTKFTDEEVENAKELIVSTVNGIEDSQDAEITYYFGQELGNKFTEIEQYVENIKKVQPDDVNKIAKKVKINTIYFLRD